MKENKKPVSKKKETPKSKAKPEADATPKKEKTQIINQQYVLKSGMLSKRSQEGGEWKQYWFVVRTSNITYYKSAVVSIQLNIQSVIFHHFPKDKKPLGKISIENVKSVSIENGLKGPAQSQYCFAVNTAKKKHALVLSTPTLSECEEWMSMYACLLFSDIKIQSYEETIHHPFLI